jgi:cytochrome c oxidase subunit III
MPTAVREPPQVGAVQKDEDQFGGGGWRNSVPVEGKLTALDDYSPEPSRTGIWIGLAAITMSFAALTSALIVSQGSATDWRHIILPPILYINTLVLLVSSLTLEIARSRVAAFARGQSLQRSASRVWLGVTLLLGFVFVAGQYVAWLRLKSAGLYLATNLSSSFFYVLTAMHALHVLGGLAALTVVILRFNKPVLSLRKSTMDSTSYYWHFMSVLWLYLLWVLWMKL